MLSSHRLPVFGLLFALALTGAGRSVQAANPWVEVGFNGFVKSDCWFPVAIGPVAGARDCEILVMESQFGLGDPKIVARYRAAFDPGTGGWKALVRLSDASRRNFLRCEFLTGPDRRRMVDVRLDTLDSSDLLMVTLSPQPADLEFLGGVERGGRRVARSVPCSTNGLPEGWLAMESVDVVVLDGRPPVRPQDVQTLRDWVRQGGAVLLTDRGLQANAGWGLYPPRPGESTYREVTGAAGSWLFDAGTNQLQSFRYLDARLPDFVTAIPFPGSDDALVAGRRFGCGCLLACGVDWRSLALKDRAQYESMRRALWTRVLDLRRAHAPRDVERDVAVPREAQVRFLMQPLFGFLALCLLLLGPVNWLLLRRLRRLEYAIFTLPAGAVLLAALAFVVGTAMRTHEVVVVDREIVMSERGGEGWSYGLSGLLSPSFRTYTVGVADPQCNLQEVHARGCGAVETCPASDDAGPSHSCTLTPGGLRIEGVDIATWSMRFFASRRPDTNGAMTAWGSPVSSNVLAGTVVNESSRAVHDVWLLFRWDFVRLGDLAPHSTNAFRLVMNLQNVKGILCPYCHTYHGSYDPFEKHACGPAPGEELKELAEAADLPFLRAPMVVGLDMSPEPLLRVEGTALPLRHDARRLLVAPVEIRWRHPAVVPFGFSFERPLERNNDEDARAKAEEIEQDFEKRLTRVGLEYVPYEFVLRDLRHSMPALQAKPAPAVTNDPEPNAGADEPSDAPSVLFFLLPPVVEKAAGCGTLTVRWDRGEPDPETPAREASLSVLDWSTGTWTDLARARTGAHFIAVTNAADCLSRPYPMVALRTTWMPEKKQADRQKQPRGGYGMSNLELMFEERSAERAP